ncbi:hypothetical protein ACO0LO_22295 [Undibacterium sp. TJN25]|uniref:hypothetical protein n=1 Tax=Undibacterium sp. TJN25 TaxID=3413056 RepID=UPI003BF39F87
MFTELVTALGSSAFTLCIAWLLKNVIKTRLTASVKYEFDAKLAELKSDFSRAKQKSASDLKSNENDIATLRSSAVTGLANRQTLFEKRRLEAIDQLWADAREYAQLKNLIEIMKTLKFNEAVKICEKEQKFRDVFATLYNTFNIDFITSQRPSTARPYISDLAWALFRTYSAIINTAIAKLYILSNGLPAHLVDIAGTEQLVRTAIYGTDSHTEQPIFPEYLLEDIEEKLLTELKRMLDGADEDKASVEKAAEIMRSEKNMRHAFPKEQEAVAAIFGIE